MHYFKGEDGKIRDRWIICSKKSRNSCKNETFVLKSVTKIYHLLYNKRINIKYFMSDQAPWMFQLLKFLVLHKIVI